MPEETATARCVIVSFDNTADNGPVYADSAFVELGSAPLVNQLSNGSFESGDSGPNGLVDWTEFADPNLSAARKNSFEVSADDGGFVLKMSGGATAGVFQDVLVTEGDTITITAKFKSSSGASYFDPNAVAGVKVEWLGVTGKPVPNIDIAPNDNPISGTTNIIDQSSTKDTWHPLIIDFTLATTEAANLRATVISGFGPGSADVYYDSFEMVLTNVFDGSDADADDDQDLWDMARAQRAFTGTDGGMVFRGIVFDQDEGQ